MPKRRLALGLATSAGSGWDIAHPGLHGVIESIRDVQTEAASLADTQVVMPSMGAIWTYAWMHDPKPSPRGAGFPAASTMESFHEEGILPAIYFHTTHFGRDDTSTKEWARGAWDDYAIEFGKQAKVVGLPFVLRINQEANGSWAPWRAGYMNQTVEDYIKAWQRTVDNIRLGLGTDAHLMKTWYTPMGSPPRALREQELNGHGYADYYPGKDYVDWLGFDKYAVRGQPGGDPSMIRMFSGIYKRVKTLGPQPIYVGEFGIIKKPGNDIYRGMWLAQGLWDIKRTKGWGRLKGLLYFNLDVSSEGRSWLMSGHSSQSILGRWGALSARGAFQRNLIW